MKAYRFILIQLCLITFAYAQNGSVSSQRVPDSKTDVSKETDGDILIAKYKQKFDAIVNTPDINNGPDWEKAKQAKAETLIRLICEIHKLEDPLFDIRTADPGTWDVSIPFEARVKGEHFVPGMDPEKIKDPEMKRVYLIAIKENQIKHQTFTRETGLRDLEASVWSYLKFYCKMLFKDGERITLDGIVKEQVSDGALRSLFKKELKLEQ